MFGNSQDKSETLRKNVQQDHHRNFTAIHRLL